MSIFVPDALLCASYLRTLHIIFTRGEAEPGLRTEEIVHRVSNIFQARMLLVTLRTPAVWLSYQLERLVPRESSSVLGSAQRRGFVPAEFHHELIFLAWARIFMVRDMQSSLTSLRVRSFDY